MRNNNSNRKEQIRAEGRTVSPSRHVLPTHSYFSVASSERRGGGYDKKEVQIEAETAQGFEPEHGIGDEQGCVRLEESAQAAGREAGVTGALHAPAFTFNHLRTETYPTCDDIAGVTEEHKRLNLTEFLCTVSIGIILGCIAAALIIGWIDSSLAQLGF
jgi:hypothetical protein